MSERFRSFSAVFPVILRRREGREEILLLRRANTGYFDGLWDFAGSGHVDEGETASQAVCRECGEELGILVRPEDVSFLHLTHWVGETMTYYDLYFQIMAYEGEPGIREPDKCSELRWFSVEALPEDMIPARRVDMDLWRNGIFYSETIG